MRASKNWLKRSLSLLLAVMMSVSLLSVGAFAADAATPQEQLESLLDEIDALNSADYTEDSWNELKEQADSVNRPVLPYDEETGDGMPDWVANIMITSLTNYEKALVPANAPWSDLYALLQEIDALNSEDYTEDSWNELKEQADTVNRPIIPYHEDTETGEMPANVANIMITNLTKLKNDLVPVAGQTTVYDQLEEKLVEAEKLNSADYTEESWAAVQEIIDSVDRPVSADNISEKLATKLLSDLEKALDALEEKPDDSLALADGTYIAQLNASTTSSRVLPAAKIVAENGKYKVTLYMKQPVSYNYDGDMYSNKVYVSTDKDDYKLDMLEVLKPEYNDTISSPDECFAAKNLVTGADLSNYKESVTAVISADNDAKFFDSTYADVNGVHTATFETETLDGVFTVNGLVSYPSKNADGSTSRTYSYALKGTIEVKKDTIAKVSEDLSGMTGTYAYNENIEQNVRDLLRNTEVTVESRGGSLYATFPINLDGFVSTLTGGQSGMLCDENKNQLEVKDGKVTLKYDSVDELVIGKTVNVYATRIDTFRGAINYYYERRLAPDFSAKPVILTDSATGIKFYTTTNYASEKAKLSIKIITDTGSTDTQTDPWAYMMTKLPKFNKAFYFQLSVTDGGNKLTDFGGDFMISVPKVEGLNDGALRLFLADWVSEWNTYQFGWMNDDIVATGDSYSLVLDSDYINGNWCIYDEMMSTTDGSGLADGTYRVPITTFNEAQPGQTSMSAQCLGEYATLVVKNGVKRLELDFQPVNIGELDGYLIQMWNENSEGEWEELKYTSYYKNEDGSYFTDELNEGTNNYYPKTGYMILPSDDVQFRANFRVSAMDAIMGDNGDATRSAIFTIYYDQAEKISDDTPDAAPEEIPNFTPADMSALNDLIAKAEALNEDDYNLSTFTTLKNALASAKAVQANTRATQEEVDSAAAELKNAIDALVKNEPTPTEPSQDDKNNLPDGKYTLTAQMIKTDRESFSMSNNAINHNVWLEVKDGEYYLTMQFKGMSIYNKYGYLMNLSYFDKGYTYNSYGVPEGTLIPAEVLSTQKDSDGNDIIDQYNDAQNLYPEMLRIKLVDKASQQFVPLQVFVPIMEAIADETGTQPVLMQLDWSTLKADNGDIQPEEPEVQSPAVDLTDTATGVKLHADKGVYPEGVKLVVTEIKDGDSYSAASKSLTDVGKKFKLYDVKVVDADGNAVDANGTVTVSFPVPDGYNADKCAVYRMNDDGTKTLVKGTVADGYFTVTVKALGQYTLVEKGSTITDAENTKNTDAEGTKSPKTGDTAPVALVIVCMAAAVCGAGVLTVYNKRKHTGD